MFGVVGAEGMRYVLEDSPAEQVECLRCGRLYGTLIHGKVAVLTGGYPEVRGEV